ncbi:MAG: DUF2804 domain-containing protein [Deltaproteobacteria bacterium]|nr:DUF2804 domain-containing protein [Deltaproteobacteria bacterium]
MTRHESRIELPAVPDQLAGEDGQPLFGAYRGVIPDASFRKLSGPGYRLGRLERIRLEKSWHYTCLASRDWFFGMVIVRLGYASTAFAYLFDRQQQRFVVDESILGPPWPASLVQVTDAPGSGARSVFRLPGFHLSILQPPGTGRYQVRCTLHASETKLDLAAELDAEHAPPGLTAICPVAAEGKVNLTAKQVALPARGRILLDEQRVELDAGCFGALDYSHGYLAHQTSWMWACAGGKATARSRRPVGLNLVCGFNDGLENAVWVGDRIVPVGGELSFRRGTGPLDDWQIRSADGELDLRFTPEGVRSDERDLGLISSSYTQPVGRFSGRLPGPDGRAVQVEDLAGVCEEHDSRW